MTCVSTAVFHKGDGGVVKCTEIKGMFGGEGTERYQGSGCGVGRGAELQDAIGTGYSYFSCSLTAEST